MSITLFATHGRGLDAFAQEEIHEKMTNVHNVQTLGEGKISFSIPLKISDSKEDKGNDEEILIGAVSPVYDLKLVERIFILLHCETFDIGETHNESGKETDHTTDRKKKPTYNDESNNQLLKKYERKLADIIDKEKWAKVAYQVQALRRFQEQRRVRVQCQDPSNCHGSVRRRAEKQKLWQRRFSEETSCSEKRMRRESAHDLSEKRATESDIASSSDLAVGPLKERLTETGISEAREMSVAISELDASRVNYDVSSTSDASQNEMDGQEATDKVILEKRGIRTNNPEGTNGKSSNPEPQVNRVSLSRESLSLRPYIPHITLRSTVAYLMARLAQVPQGGVALDPMCGGGTILLEMAKCFEVGLIIGGDVSQEQLRVSRCNLQDVGVPFSLLRMDAAAMPLMSQSVSVVVCDVPFGQKHQLKDENESTMLQELLCECQRVLKCSGRLVLLISTRQLEILRKIMPCLSSFQHTVLAEEQETSQLKLDATYQVSLGETSAHIAVLQMLPCK
ncbi:putative THUMP domain-containing protein 2 [Penaeus vannamei]|uniref:Putative THUMP domain-containing protein 2 n=1 Tax=Penaeus vannamei TaxID=6689 RepID=A0A3R7Q384_PENVA|nr:putative THUMP domain-containing protein 2 [Penaeus vannamei]